MAAPTFATAELPVLFATLLLYCKLLTSSNPQNCLGTKPDRLFDVAWHRTIKERDVAGKLRRHHPLGGSCRTVTRYSEAPRPGLQHLPATPSPQAVLDAFWVVTTQGGRHHCGFLHLRSLGLRGGLGGVGLSVGVLGMWETRPQALNPGAIYPWSITLPVSSQLKCLSQLPVLNRRILQPRPAKANASISALASLLLRSSSSLVGSRQRFTGLRAYTWARIVAPMTTEGNHMPRA